MIKMKDVMLLRAGFVDFKEVGHYNDFPNIWYQEGSLAPAYFEVVYQVINVAGEVYHHLFHKLCIPHYTDEFVYLGGESASIDWKSPRNGKPNKTTDKC